jgi:uncharacterized protein YdiU (UPF0061 family)
MPESTETPTQGAPAETERTFTQAELDAIVGDRLKRERAKYADYEDVKAKAQQFDAAQEAAKSDLEKAVEERDRLKEQLEQWKAERDRAEQVAKAAAEHGVDPALLARMAGDVEENAQFLRQQLAAQPRYPTLNDQGDPKPQTASKADIMAIRDPVERLKAIAANKDIFDT